MPGPLPVEIYIRATDGTLTPYTGSGSTGSTALDIDDLAVGQKLMANSVPVVIASDQSGIAISTPDTVVTVTPTCDTSAYASGDLLFDSTEIAAAVRENGGCAILQNVTIIDKDDQGVPLTLLFANAATDFGTLNSAPDPDDTECATVIGWLAVSASDYIDLGGARVACLRNIGLLLKAGAATTSIYVAAVNGTSAPTFSAAGLVLHIGLLRS